MCLIKELIGSIIYQLNVEESYNILLSKLRNLNLSIEKLDREKNMIIVSCLSKLTDIGFWKCYGKKLIFEIHSLSPKTTKIDIFGKPDFLRIKIKKGEKLIDLNELISKLKEL
jgi:hypothetical protein